MKNLFQSSVIFSAIVLFLIGGNCTNAQTYPIKVAIYADAGVNLPDTADFVSCLSDPALFKTTLVLGADIRAGILNNFDVLICPGGSGSGESASLQPSGLDSIRSFVYRGGGYLGVCAGDYLASSYYSWSLHIINTNAVDAAHWNRGDGTVIVDLSNVGKSFFNMSSDSFHVQYLQGMLMTPAGVDTLPAYLDLGKFVTEISSNGAPPGIMIGTTAFAQSVFGMGRVFTSAPHPEKTDSLHYMIVDIVKWIAGKTPFSKIASPQDSTQWVAGSSRNIQWVSGEGVDTMYIDYSTDGGSTWSLINSAAVGYSFIWTVPNTPSINCRMRVRSNNRLGISDISSFVITPALPTITSVQSGSWNVASTWSGGVIPDSMHNVVISAGHTVTVNAYSKCLDLSFGDASARLGLNGNLNIFGNFVVYNENVNPFYTTTSLWTPGAKMIFKGDQAEQTIINLNTSSSGPYPVRFDELVIDKSAGKFTTGTGNNYKLGIGTSLEIINGTFELMSTDDIEGRNVSGTATTPTITVDSNGVFNMIGSSSDIRRGNFTGEESEKIGLMTIFGQAYLACGTSNKVSFTNISIENGGVLHIASGRGWNPNVFNPGTVFVKNGGTLYNSTTTNVWYTNLTTPTTIDLQKGGIFVSYSSTTPFPPNINNNGTVRYAASTFNQTITDANYSRLELSYSGGFNKTWALGDNRIISDSLETNNSAALVLSSAAQANLTINGTVNLVSGSINNSGSNVTVILGGNASLFENSGLITGFVKTTRTLNQNQPDSLGGLGIVINAAGGSPGITTVLRRTDASITANGNQGITRIYKISPANNSSLDAAVSLSYNTNDLNLIPESNLILFQSSDSLNWSALLSTLDKSNNIITVNHLNNLNYLTAGSSSAPLPVELTKFTSENIGRNVVLNWITITELNSNKFEIERTLIGSDKWKSIGSVNAAFLSTSPKYYSYTDKDLQAGKFQYKLKMVDNDGSSQYSKVLEADVTLPKNFELGQNYPNPFNPSTKINYQLPVDSRITLELFDITGKRVAELVNQDENAGYYTVNVNSTFKGNNLSSGVYFYRIIAIDKVSNQKFINIKKMIMVK